MSPLMSPVARTTARIFTVFRNALGGRDNQRIAVPADGLGLTAPGPVRLRPRGHAADGRCTTQAIVRQASASEVCGRELLSGDDQHPGR